MRILITEWALASYLDLRKDGVLSREVYWQVLRPDIESLAELSSSERFKDASFWGPAQALGGRRVQDGWKMKWHNVGNARQLRLCVALVDRDAYLCHAYQKSSASGDWMEGAKLEVRIQIIREGKAEVRGAIHDRRT